MEPASYNAVLKVLADRAGVPVAEYVRRVLHDHIGERGVAFMDAAEKSTGVDTH